MPLYEYDCPQCGRFEIMKAIEQRHRAKCPSCNSESKLLMSRFSHYWKNIVTSGTQGGEGFTSTTYNPKEADIRVEHNLQKSDKV